MPIYYKIIPLIKIPINKDPKFTYKSKEKIPFGSLVIVPFGKKTVKGIVLNSTKKPYFRTREIQNIKTFSAINEVQLSLAEKISAYYFTSLGITLKLFVFNLTKKPPGIVFEKIPEIPKVTLTQQQKKVVQKITANPSKIKNLVFGPASSGKTEIAMAMIEKTLANQKQSLIILPEVFLSYQEIYRYQKRFFNKKVALLHSKLKPSELSAIWNGIKSGEIEILIATKIGCFMPFKNLGIIVIDEEQDISHKNWDQNPKYHTAKVAKWLTAQHNAKLLFLSATPSVKNYWKTKNKLYNWRLLELPALKTKEIKVLKPKINIINLWENSYQKTGDILFSKDLLEDFKKTLKKNKISLILVPYHGKSQAVFCENCKTALKCPKCQTSLVHSKDEYKCLHCNYKTSSLTSCPNCKSYKLKNIGFGTESVASELTKFFPKSKRFN